MDKELHVWREIVTTQSDLLRLTQGDRRGKDISQFRSFLGKYI